MDKDVALMTDEELDKAIEKKYGEDWSASDIDDNDELIVEFFHRAQMGSD